MLIAFLFGFGAAIAAVGAEFCYKQPWAMNSPWWHHLWLWAPMQLFIGYCIYRMVNVPGTNLLDAVIVFALCSAVLRIITALFVLHQDVPVPSWVGFALVLSATLVKTLWRV